jgi:hypothetical protein
VKKEATDQEAEAAKEAAKRSGSRSSGEFGIGGEDGGDTAPAAQMNAADDVSFEVLALDVER